jgi:mono/diheme cytochrome c family protein
MSPLSIVLRSQSGRSRRAMLETLIRHLDMVRLTLSAVLLAVLATGCVGIIGDEASDGLSVNQRKARSLFIEKALPTMKANCAGCHATLPNLDFLKGATDLEVYAALKEHQPAVINYIDGTKSRLVTIAEHSGPAFSTTAKAGAIDSDYEVMLEWLRAEQRASGDVPIDGGTGKPGSPTYILTEKITPVVCTGTRAACARNELTLQGIRPDKTGIDAKVTFLYEVLPTSNSPYIVDMKLEGGAEGAYIESPLFIGYVGDKSSVDGDALFDIKTNAGINAKVQIGSGFAGLTGLVSLGDGGVVNPIAMSFQVLDKYKPETTVVNPSVCKQVASFVANVKPILQASCANCHGVAAGNAGAKGNMLFDAANDAASCQQAKANATDLNAIATQPIFIAPKPGASNHPFKLPNSAAWEAAVTTWLNAEKTSP